MKQVKKKEDKGIKEEKEEMVREGKDEREVKRRE